MSSTFINVAYLIASILFIFGLKGLTHPRTAVQGNRYGALAMFIAVAATLLDQQILSFEWILIGVLLGGLIGGLLAAKIAMTDMPQLVALFNGFGGGASVLVAGAALIEAGLPTTPGTTHTFTVATAASGIIGAVTFWGSLIAFAKLQELMSGNPMTFPGQQVFNVLVALACLALGGWIVADPTAPEPYWIMTGIASLLGILIVIPVGGADMPV
ncbi:MAG: NAD(P)(+) transhydrogenase (Re/Si-specific) subunit beta, partial [Candidatus Latescibacteria bacterium]|nr:NAD(P)(+) transhydrogenase (Re/Si-specific) subunit beta [Candidatus Latescibacterota bacterium]